MKPYRETQLSHNKESLCLTIFLDRNSHDSQDIVGVAIRGGAILS